MCAKGVFLAVSRRSETHRTLESLGQVTLVSETAGQSHFFFIHSQSAGWLERRENLVLEKFLHGRPQDTDVKVAKRDAAESIDQAKHGRTNPTTPEATTLLPRPDQKANPTGFANPRTTPVAKSPRVEGKLIVEGRRGARAHRELTRPDEAENTHRRFREQSGWPDAEQKQ